MENNTLCNRHSLGVNNHTKMYVTYTRIYGWSDYGGESSYQPGYRLENMMWMTLLVYDYIIPGDKNMLPISDILIRSISGYVFIVPVFILYFLYLKKSGRKQSLLHITAVFLFYYYLFGILTVTGIGYTSTISFRPRISLIPFLGMISGPIDTILNVVLFVPFGFFLPLLYKKYHHIKTVVLTGFLFSLSVEIVQMFGWGSTDINDLITNTVGVCLGYLVYYLLSKVLPNNLRKQFQSENVNDMVEVPLFAIYTFIIMVTVQPWVIHSLLNIG